MHEYESISKTQGVNGAGIANNSLMLKKILEISPVDQALFSEGPLRSPRVEHYSFQHVYIRRSSSRPFGSSTVSPSSTLQRT